MTNALQTEFKFYREYWTGHSRDGRLKDADGYHFLKILPDGRIIEAYEWYETLDGEEVSTSIPELVNVNWLKDLGYDDFGDLEEVNEDTYLSVKELADAKGDPANLQT